MGAEKGNNNVFNDFIDSLTNKDIKKALFVFDKSAKWITPEGEFYGHEEIGHYLKWFGNNIRTIGVADTGLISEGNNFACEMVLEGSNDGEDWQVTAISMCEITNDRIKSLKTVYDRLSVARQVARDGLAGLAVSKIIERMEEGLH